MIKQRLFRVLCVGAMLGFAGVPNAAPITQNTDPLTIWPNYSVACINARGSSENSYYRAFDLAGLGYRGGEIRSVQFGVEVASGGPQDVTVHLYTLGATLERANLVPIRSVVVTVPDQTRSLITVPLTPSVPFDTNDALVVEIFSPDGWARGTTFKIGSNNAGESAPSYIRAPGCGWAEPKALADIDFSSKHIVMSLDVTLCGDGVADGHAGEACDDGNAIDGDGCDTNCTVTACGNGIVTPGEICDDGDLESGDGCDANCTPTGCGNGIVTDGELCDDGNDVDGDGCDAGCIPTACGNGVVSPGEICDDGNLESGDGCDSNCTPTGCGNGIQTAGEICEDGNTIDGDGCDSNCTPTACGNGVVTAGEACDDGNDVDGDGCDSNCTATACGNGVVTAGEACDDGNDVDGDGCDSNCTPTACGNGIQTAGEECDDGNQLDGDGCDANCTATACGNGIVTAGEECDDGNQLDGDGCDATCRVESRGGGGGCSAVGDGRASGSMGLLLALLALLVPLRRRRSA